MWTCGLLKRNAKQALSGRYWLCTAVCLIAGVFGASSVFSDLYAQFEYALSFVRDFTRPDVWTGNQPDVSFAEIFEAMSVTGLLAAVLLGMLIGVILGSVYRAFVSGPLSAGLCRYMMESRQGGAPFGTLFTIFRKPYLNVVKVLFLTDLKIVLGYIIIIPGIYWTYCYRQVPYLMAENPYLTTGRAMELSRQMMHGEKFHSFLLDLSFIGWDLLCLVTFGLGQVFLVAYREATYAEFYAAMRAKALSYGFSDESELGGFVRHSSPNHWANA